MPRPAPDVSAFELTSPNVSRVVSAEDDFGHELRVGAVLRNYLYPEHGGTYSDPVSGKPRQFDYRAEVCTHHSKHRLLLAIECKNLNPAEPMVVCGVDRTEMESYIEVVGRWTDSRVGHEAIRPSMYYRAGAFVGKSVVRIRRGNEGLMKGPDADVYEKWAQALASSHDLVNRALFSPVTPPNADTVNFAVIPVVVVPDGALWSVRYDSDGKQAEQPAPADGCSLFVGYYVGAGSIDFPISHLHFFTTSGFVHFFQNLIEGPGLWRLLFQKY